MHTTTDTLTADLPCTGCAYNLRGIDADGACPECGLPVRTTLDDRVTGRPAWLRRVALGSLLIGVGLFVGVVGAVGLLLRFGFTSLHLLPVGAVIGAVGSWWFASPPARRASGGAGDELSAAIRVTSVATCALQVQTALIIVAAMRGFFSGSGNALPWLAWPTVITWSVAAFLTCFRASQVASEVGDGSGAFQARLLSVFASGAILLGAWTLTFASGGHLSPAARVTLAAVAISVAVSSAVFFAGFAVVLRQAARRTGQARWG